ncbi:MAG: hypothetical protein B9J98_01495 [Candidatus Terraquivivens tikiterensis]|uniref:Uncharacterized protein n=1 Tax=Candidatus Terraquivivens tikiterensis TaxID=1980982 RepID=A0A2R7YB27_9ARCH|nr:MAG: hypothetical protein B9J98_01495 [Candidatus Terraquivivens tikiterensis]
MAWGWRGMAGPWPGRGPFSYLPPWQRPGWLFGFGRGFGWLWSYLYNPWVCARFPWLPRWWWAYPLYGYAWPYMAYGFGYWYPWYWYPLYGYW